MSSDMEMCRFRGGACCVGRPVDVIGGRPGDEEMVRATRGLLTRSACQEVQIRKSIYTYSHLAARLCTRNLISEFALVHRLTINLPAELHAALKAAAARRGTTIGSLVQESLEAYGIKPERDVRELVAAARVRSGLSANEAKRLALQETRAARDGNR